MTDTSIPLTSQEKVAGAVAYIFPFFPHITGVKTDFSLFHAKQSLILWCIALFFIIFQGILLYIWWMVSIILMVTSAWCIYMAYQGEKFVIPILGEKMESIYSTTGLARFFTTK